LPVTYYQNTIALSHVIKFKFLSTFITGGGGYYSDNDTTINHDTEITNNTVNNYYGDSGNQVNHFMYRRPILCTFHIAADFIIVRYKCLYGWGERIRKVTFRTRRIQNAEYRIQKHMFIKLPMYLSYYMALRRKDSDAGPNGTSFACCHLRAQKSLDFQGLPFPMALVMDVARIKIITP
jgi:hypothetical protein